MLLVNGRVRQAANGLTFKPDDGFFDLVERIKIKFDQRGIAMDAPSKLIALLMSEEQ